MPRDGLSGQRAFAFSFFVDDGKIVLHRELTTDSPISSFTVVFSSLHLVGEVWHPRVGSDCISLTSWRWTWRLVPCVPEVPALWRTGSLEEILASLAYVHGPPCMGPLKRFILIPQQEYMLRGFIHQDRPLRPPPHSKILWAKRELVTPSILNLFLSVLLLEQIFLTAGFVQIPP